MKNKVIIGTRTSKLALYQTNQVKKELKKNFPDLDIEIIEVKTKGDILLDKPLDRNLDKGYFVKEIQELLIQNKIDIAVHSLKDLPVEELNELKISAILKRGNPQDVFLSRKNKKLSEFNDNELIGTTSLRRKAQLLKLNPKLKIKDVRGNVDTRVKKMIEGKYDGLVMAAAGIERLKLNKHITEYLDFNSFLNAPGQGAIAVETNTNNSQVTKIVSTINHEKTMICTKNERDFMKKMGGGCNYPIGAYAYIQGDKLFLEGIVLSLDGKKSIKHAVNSLNYNNDLATELSKKFNEDNVRVLINEIDNEIR
tara:strand:- start:221 stop:1150 length:930 start_codon:yes stop_codon:yes gene_type:complete